jgi:hypothetical protein
MSKKKPNYTQYMKRPAPLELSPPSDREHGPVSTAPATKNRRVLEEELPWGEVIVEFGPDDSAPLRLAPDRTAPQVEEIPAEISIPFGTIVRDTEDVQSAGHEPSSEAARPPHRRAAPASAPTPGAEASGSSLPVAHSGPRSEREIQPRVAERLDPEAAPLDQVPAPPLGVMAMAVAIVVILFLLVQST